MPHDADHARRLNDIATHLLGRSMRLAELEGHLRIQGHRVTRRQLRYDLEALQGGALPGYSVEPGEKYTYSAVHSGQGRLSAPAAALLTTALDAVATTFGAESLRALYGELAPLLPVRLRAVFQSSARPVASMPGAHLAVILRAWAEGRPVTLRYRKNDRVEPETYRNFHIASVTLSTRNARPMLVGFKDGDPTQVRSLRLDRVSHPMAHTETTDEARDAYINADMAANDHLEPVVLEFDTTRLVDAAQRLSEEHVRRVEIGEQDGTWLRAVLLAPLRDGIPITERQWILGWGASVRVISPAPARAWWRGEVEAMTRLLADDS